MAKYHDFLTPLDNELLAALTATNNTINDTTTGLPARILRSGDTMLGPLNVQPPAASSQPIILSQNPSGENRPFREFRNVQAGTPVIGMNPGTGNTVVMDAMGLGRAYSIRSFIFKVKQAPLATQAVTITLSRSTGETVFSKVYAIGVLTLTNNILTLIGATDTSYPEVPGGTTLVLTVTNCKINASIDGILVTPDAL